MNGFDLSTVSGIYIGNQLASAVYCGSNLIWEAHNYANDWFTIEAIDNCDITFTASEVELVYSIGDAQSNGWTGFFSDENNTVSLQSGEKMCITCKYDESEYTNYYGTFSSTGRFKVYGNIMSLLTYEKSQGDMDGSAEYADFRNLTDLSSYPTYIFSKLFENCTYLVDASNLVLPATTLVNYCYHRMFYGCTSLTKAPKLPATTLTNNCYYEMFRDCTSLTTAPELPATTLAMDCYQYMFYGCTSLITAPELPATTLAAYCYYNMFRGCTALTTAPALPATTLTEYCYSNMFRNCTSLITAPELPATTLTVFCYSYMFYGCTSLNYIKCLAVSNGSSSYTLYWLNNVSNSGTFIKHSSMTSWTTGVNGIPSGWNILDA